ncbi:MAG: GNAT family N-acetyltransferase [Chloroflexota bacterium]
MPGEKLQSEPLGPRHDRQAFSCGVEPLDRYLRQQAGQEQRRNVAVPYVLVDVETGAIVGYYTLSAFTIAPASLPSEASQKLPRYRTYPAILIGRLALDHRYHGKGLGRVLLADALTRCRVLSKELAAIAVVVDAKDDRARSFYEHVGFLRLLDDPYRLYLPMATIARSIPSPTTPGEAAPPENIPPS